MDLALRRLPLWLGAGLELGLALLALELALELLPQLLATNNRHQQLVASNFNNSIGNGNSNLFPDDRLVGVWPE